MPHRNPDWTEEELILAYEVLIDLKDQPLSKDLPEIIRLSELLNELPIHDGKPRSKPFRDPDGVRRRLDYLRRIQNGQQISGRKIYKLVVNQYKGGPQGLRAAAESIRRRYGV